MGRKLKKQAKDAKGKMDDIQKILKGVGDITAFLMGKKNPANEIIVYDEIVSSHELYKIIFQLLEEGEICKAEDALFLALEKEINDTKFAVGEEFYNTVGAYSDEELQKKGFSREEVRQGIQDLKRVCGK